ncbi:DNA polymerase ligase N-terminal domain-containing protein [Mucilaginibacter auburnensis]|uniref:DNA ligase D-like protein (Predicted 3'-phosphoesterase) n=1 Tax=Mucilaginibacter auburnensis TaxID=1457233 RepID=A0A2H9VPT6_9SPHI|nr:DNA polymerase ligase N-terminal domain-containing protein [Mucilaginibacter auburnensis]PJJ80312.1 DNA ligase D-like protein (predicted 3'-phosphoesterase) [Mucilaginibacter auburnensis]
MGLETYVKKRDFKQTSEPKGGKSDSKNLSFVIQRHHASRLHYDFRLELDGTLKSWAVPKGPSLNPNDKRLAMMVEDHPIDYQHFEGIIPNGNYGAGVVIIWDKGTYTSLADDRKDDITQLRAGLKSGNLKFRLDGDILKGEFALVKIKNPKDDNAWLLIKHRDEFAVDDFDSENLVPDAVKKMKNNKEGKAKALPKQHKVKEFDNSETAEEEEDQYFTAYTGKEVMLVNGDKNDASKTYKKLISELKAVKREAVFEGEIVKEGRTNKFKITDLISLDEHDLSGLEPKKRSKLLEAFVEQLGSNLIVLSDE